MTAVFNEQLPVDRMGIEPTQSPCKGDSPALEHSSPRAAHHGFEPRPGSPKLPVLPLD